MPRPRKCRRIEFMPENQYFYPQREDFQEVVLTFDEVEAIRLSDYEALEQENAAENMNISRGTFQRILNAARYKIADALINGKAICIKGGDYEFVRKSTGGMRHCRRHRGGRG
ncbi:MAG: DUF134 domain-containing protein [Clostridiales bacterium]|nr:DUF134 domain-containing protein [Clostridiales bacterium]